ncbi:MAG: long-chain acyl-CoA synthetase [Arenicella sp.]|jgi:long-chain acyl-CoA synthetase
MSSFAERMAAELNPDDISSLVEAFKNSCRLNADKPAFECFDHSITFAELEQLTERFSSYLMSELGLKIGDRIAIQLPNITQYPIAVWGAWRAGLVVVNTNPMYTAREVLHQFKDSGAIALVVLDSLLPLIDKVIGSTDIKHVIATSAIDLAQPSKGFQATESVLAFNDALKAEITVVDAARISMDDIAALQYTGGTTGPSKGAMLTHSNLFCARTLSRKSVVLNKPGAKEILIAVLPLYHVFGFTANVVGSVLFGGLSVMIPDPRNLDSIIAAMKSHPFTNMAGVNTLLSGLMRHPEFDSVDFSNITGVIVGGTALVKEIGEEWQRRTGTMLYEGYGLSETSSNGACNRPESNELGTVGPSMLFQEIKTVDAAGESVVTGERGEICIRGPHVMKGYWGRPEATAEAIDKDGWFKTGDIGIIQHNAHLKIVDRIKDMVIVSGFNVYPNEVEAVIYGHPNVIECAVIGVPSELTGEAIKLYLVSDDEALAEDDIIDFCRAELTAYKVPKQIVFMSDLPKSPAGKVLRRELRKMSLEA